MSLTVWFYFSNLLLFFFPNCNLLKGRMNIFCQRFPKIMRSRRNKQPAGGGSAAAAALKGRATNQPSCYVNVGSTGIGMLSAGHYVAPPPGTILSSVEEFAKDSLYFQDFATVESTDDVVVSALDNFLHNRGPSFGPDYAPKNRSSSSGHNPAGNMTPSMTRTVDLKVFQRGSRHGPSSRSMNQQPAIPEEDDHDNNSEEEEEEDVDPTEYDDDDDEFEDDDSEDEPFSGADAASTAHHPSSSYVSSIVQDAKKEKDKQMLLSQAFAYVTKVEKENQREEQQEARRARRGGGKSKSKKGASSSSNSRSKQPRSRSNQLKKQARQPRQPRQPRQSKQSKQSKQQETGRGGERPTQLGAARDRAQSRLYGVKKKTNKSVSETTTSRQAPAAPTATAVLQDTYINLTKEEEVTKKQPVAIGRKKRESTTTKVVVSSGEQLESGGEDGGENVIGGGGARVSTNNEENHDPQDTMGIHEESSIADHFLSFQPPPTDEKEEQQQQKQQQKQQHQHQQQKQQHQHQQRSGGGRRSRKSEGSRPSGVGQRPSARDRPPQSSVIPEVPMSALPLSVEVKQCRQPEEDVLATKTKRVKNGELTKNEIAALVSNLESGSTAQKLRAQLDSANEKMSESEMAFKRAQEEFALLL